MLAGCCGSPGEGASGPESAGFRGVVTGFWDEAKTAEMSPEWFLNVFRSVMSGQVPWGEERTRAKALT